MKSDMAPPTGRPTGGPGESDQSGGKPDRYAAQTNGQVGHGAGEGDTVQDHEAEYIPDGNAAYHANRNSYNLWCRRPWTGHAAAPPPQSHQNGGDQMTPRTATGAPASGSGI